MRIVCVYYITPLSASLSVLCHVRDSYWSYISPVRMEKIESQIIAFDLDPRRSKLTFPYPTTIDRRATFNASSRVGHEAWFCTCVGPQVQHMLVSYIQWWAHLMMNFKPSD